MLKADRDLVVYHLTSANPSVLESLIEPVAHNLIFSLSCDLHWR
jgi:hypothetical protein